MCPGGPAAGREGPRGRVRLLARRPGRHRRVPAIAGPAGSGRVRAGGAGRRGRGPRAAVRGAGGAQAARRGPERRAGQVRRRRVRHRQPAALAGLQFRDALGEAGERLARWPGVGADRKSDDLLGRLGVSAVLHGRAARAGRRVAAGAGLRRVRRGGPAEQVAHRHALRPLLLRPLPRGAWAAAAVLQGLRPAPEGGRPGAPGAEPDAGQGAVSGQRRRGGRGRGERGQRGGAL
mmetsp:Transcript_117653/g.310802  ORF Transcript_117653/g.310802 Transcript_117653/m.310802 type:complete len:234 (-) Transcript_117653:726-1427(-)